jgi:hypothetical protein
MQEYFRHFDLIDGQHIGKKTPGSQAPPPGWRPEAAVYNSLPPVVTPLYVIMSISTGD